MYKRQSSFEKKFDFEFLSLLRKMVDYKKNSRSCLAIDYMPELLQQLPEILEHFFGAEQGKIVKDLMSKIRSKVKKQPHLTPSILNHDHLKLEEINWQALISNLQRLKDEYLQVHSRELLEIQNRLTKQGLKKEAISSAMYKEFQNSRS